MNEVPAPRQHLRCTPDRRWKMRDRRNPKRNRQGGRGAKNDLEIQRVDGLGRPRRKMGERTMKFHLGPCKKHIGTDCTTCTNIRTGDGEPAKKAEIIAELERLEKINMALINQLKELVDTAGCKFDPEGTCQTHGETVNGFPCRRAFAVRAIKAAERGRL